MKQLNKLLFTGFLFIVILPGIISAQFTQKTYDLVDHLSSEHMIESIRDISSAAFEGRELGTSGNRKAQNWVAAQFRKYGLQPFVDLNGYKQNFGIRSYSQGSDNRFYSANDTLRSNLFSPAYYSASDSVTAPFFSLGTVENLSEVELEKHNIKGSVVYVHIARTDSDLMRPEGFELARELQLAGAKAVIYSFYTGEDHKERRFNPSGNPYVYHNDYYLPTQAVKNITNTYMPFVPDVSVTIPVAYLNHDIAQNITNDEPVTMITSVRGGLKNQASNIVAFREGSHYPGQYILISTPFDHEGLHPHKGNPYMGANKASSGLAALVGFARAMHRFDQLSRYSLLFVAFNGDERYRAGEYAFFESELAKSLPIVHHIHLESLGYSLVPHTSVAVIETDTTNRFFPILKRTNRNPKIDVHFNHINNPDRTTITGDEFPYSHRILDSQNALNYVQLYRSSQYSLQALWLLANSRQR
jgi:hypothetical protein